MVEHGSCPRSGVTSSRDARQIGCRFAACPTHRVAADTTLVVEYALACGGVSDPFNVARLVQEGKDVRHFLGVQLRVRPVLSSDLPPHAGSVVPEHGHNPAHCGGAGMLAGEVRGNAPPRSIDGMADSALLVTIKQLSAILRHSDDIEGAACG